GVTVVYATDAHTPGDSELRKWPPHAMAGSWNAEIVPGLAPEPGDIVLGKQTYSPFLNPAFERTLTERGLTRLYVTGLHTACRGRGARAAPPAPHHLPHRVGVGAGQDLDTLHPAADQDGRVRGADASECHEARRVVRRARVARAQVGAVGELRHGALRNPEHG